MVLLPVRGCGAWGIEWFLAKRLKLRVNKAKSAVAKPSVRKFLGFSFTCGEQPRRCIAPQALARFKARVRELTRRTRGRSLAQIVNELSVYLVGWRGYFRFCQTPSVLRALDEWTRRRLRAIAWKQWKRERTRFAELQRRGVGRDLAARTAGSPRGPWRLANSPALAIALPNAFLGSLLGSLGLAPVAAPCTTYNPPNRRTRTRTSGGVGGAKSRDFPLSQCSKATFVSDVGIWSRDRRDRGQNLVVVGWPPGGDRGQIMKRLTSAQQARLERAKLVVVAARERAARTALRYAAQPSTMRPMRAPTVRHRRRLVEMLSAKS